MNTKNTVKTAVLKGTIRDAVDDYLDLNLHTTFEQASPAQIYKAVAAAVNALLAK